MDASLSFWSTQTFYFMFVFWLKQMACEILVLHQDSNPCPLLWKYGVLATEPPGKSFNGYFKMWIYGKYRNIANQLYTKKSLKFEKRMWI